MMMLDSSLGKILSTSKPVEPSVPGNSDNSETKNDSVTTSIKSEAEVRIVFRLIVEEQIVFKGKIEQVKQLESEELIRTVSRIAWDRAKEEKKPMLNNGSVENGDIMDIDEGESLHPDRHNSDESHKLAEDLTEVDSRQTPTDELPCETNDTYSNPKETQNNSLDFTVPTDVVKTDTAGKDPISARSTPENPVRDDAKTPTYYYHICEKDMQQNSSPNIQENDMPQQTVDAHDQSHQNDKLLIAEVSSQAQSSTDADAAADSQVIAEALNDCVYNVDLESRKCNIISITNNELTSPKQTQLQEPCVSSGDARNLQNFDRVVDTSKEIAKLDKKPLTEAANNPPNQDITQETITNSEDGCLIDKSARAQACKDDLNLRTNSSKKPDIILTSRRRNTCDTAAITDRRIRRSGSKDLRGSRISSAVRQGENAVKNDTVTLDAGPPSRQFAHQTKVFAKWSDNHFYPGTILKSARDRKFEIGFFDGARKDVVETDLIPLGNIICKQVRVSIARDYCVNAIVHQQVSINGQPSFDVSYQQNGLVRKCVPLRDIFLTAEQGVPLINQPIKPDKNPDESMFAGVDLDNIVHNKRSRRLQEMEDLGLSETIGSQPNISLAAGRKKRGQYNTRTSTNRVRAVGTNVVAPNDRGLKRSHSDVNNRDTPTSSCSPDNVKPQLHSSNSNPPSESSSSNGSSNSAANAHDIGQDFYFESTSPHRTKTSLLS